VFAEDINQLLGRGIPIVSELANQFGIAESEVKALVSSGAVSFDDIETAFSNMTSEGGKFAGMMGKQSTTLGGLWSTAKDNVGLALTDIGTSIMEVFNLKEGLGAFISSMGSIRGRLAQTLGGFPQTWFYRKMHPANPRRCFHS
jgi:phage tail tape-measure protein